MKEGVKMKQYHEDDREIIPQYILDMSQEETEILMKKAEKRMNKMHKKAMKKNGYRSIEEKLKAAGCKIPMDYI